MARPAIVMLAALILAGIMACIGPPAQAAPEPAPQVHIRLDEPTTREALVSVSSNCVEFWGAVHLDKRPADWVEVILDIVSDTGWSCKINPSTFTISDTALHPFNFNVTVPEAALAAVEGHINLTAIAKGKGFTTSDRAMANVTVAPYFRLQMESEEPFHEVAPGEGTVFKLKIHNFGNIVDSFRLEIENIGELNAAGWSVQLDKSLVSSVPVKGAADFTVSASSPQDWIRDLWINKPTVIDIKATSTGATEHQVVETKTFPVYAYERGLNMPLFGMITASIILAAVAIAAAVMVRRRRRKIIKGEAR